MAQPGSTVIFVAAIVAVLIGSVPTTDWLGRSVGVDLRKEGSANPGSRNAWAVGGAGLGLTVLAVELVKGAGAVLVGRWLADDPGGALAAVGAVAGNVYNPWFRWQGGKGLAIAGGTILGLWPIMVPVLGVVIGGSMLLFRKSGPAALVTLAVYILAAGLGLATTLPVGWGVTSTGWLLLAAVGSSVLMAPKHVADALRPAGPPRSRE